MSTEDDEPSEGAGVGTAQPGGIQDEYEEHQDQDAAEDQDEDSSGASRAASSGYRCNS